METENAMIKKEAMKLKHKVFVVALHLMSMHDNKTEE